MGKYDTKVQKVTAFLLKQLGFDEPISSQELPTIYAAQSWLRDVHNISVEPIGTTLEPPRRYRVFINSNTTIDGDFLTYDAALEYGVIYAMNRIVDLDGKKRERTSPTI